MQFYSFQAILCVLLCGLSLKQATWAASSTTTLAPSNVTLAPSNVESLPVMITTNQSLSVKASVPIELPPGTAQFTPQLQLEYDTKTPHIASGELYTPHCIVAKLNTTLSLALKGMSKLSCAKLGADSEKYDLDSRFRIKWARAPHSPPILKTALDNGQCFSRLPANAPWLTKAIGKQQCLQLAADRSDEEEFKWAVNAVAKPVYDRAPSDTPSASTSLSHWSLKGAPFVQICQHQAQPESFKYGYHTNLCLVNGQHEQVMEFVGIANNTTQSHNNQQRQATYRLLNKQGHRLNHLDITLSAKTLIINNRLSGKQQIFKQPLLTKKPIYLIKETHIKPFTQNLIRYDWQFVDSPEGKFYRIGKIFYGKNTGVVSEDADSTPEQHFNHTVTFEWFNNRITSYPQFIHIGSRLGHDDRGSQAHVMRYTYNLIPRTIDDKNSINYDLTTGLICTSFYQLLTSPPKYCDNLYATTLKIAETPHKPEIFDYFRLSGITKSNHRSATSRQQRASFFYDACTTGHGGCLVTVIQGDAEQPWAKKRRIIQNTYRNESWIRIAESNNQSSPFTIDKTATWTIIRGKNQRPLSGITRSESKLFENIFTYNSLTHSSTEDVYAQTLLTKREHSVYRKDGDYGVITTETEDFVWSNNGLTQYRKTQFNNDDKGEKHRQQDISTTTHYDKKCFNEQQHQLISNPICDTSNEIAVANRITTVTAVNSDLTNNTINYLVAEQVINNNNTNTELSHYQCQSSSNVAPVNSNANRPAFCADNEKVSVVTYSPITDSYQQVTQDVMRQQHYTTTYTSLGAIQKTEHQDKEFGGQPHIVTYKHSDAWRLDAIEDNRSSLKQTFGTPTYTGHPSSQSTYSHKNTTQSLISQQVTTIDPLLLTVNRLQSYAADNTLVEDTSYQLLRPLQGKALHYATHTQDNLNHVTETRGYNHQGQVSIASTMASDTQQPIQTTTWEYVDQQLNQITEYDKNGKSVSTTAFQYTPLQQLQTATTTKGKHSQTVQYRTIYHDLSKNTSVWQKNGNTLLGQHNWFSAINQITDSPSTPKTTSTIEYWQQCLEIRAYRVITQVIEKGSTEITNKQCFNTSNQLIANIPQEGLATQYDYYQNHLLKSKTQCGHNQNKNSCQNPVSYEYYKNDSSTGKAYVLKSITTDKHRKDYQYQADTGYVSDVTVSYLSGELRNVFGGPSSFTTSYSNFDTYGRPLTIDYNVDVSLTGTPIDVNQGFQIKKRYGTGENAHRLEAITYPQSLNHNDSLTSDVIPGVVATFNYTSNNKNDPFSEIELSVDNAPAFKAAAYPHFHRLEDTLTYDTPAYKQNYWYNYWSLRNIPTALQCLVTGKGLAERCEYYLAQDKKQRITILDRREHHLTAGRILFKDKNPSISVSAIKPAQDYLNDNSQHLNTRYSKSINPDKKIYIDEYPLDHLGNQKSTTYSFNEKDQIIGQYHQLGGNLSHYDYVEGFAYDTQNRLKRHTRDLVTTSPIGPYDPRSYFDLNQTMTYNAFGNILQSDSRKPPHLNPPNPLHYTNSQELYDKLAANVASQLQSKGIPLDYLMPHILKPEKNAQGLVSKLVKNGNKTTFYYDNDNQRLTQVMFEPDQYYDGISYGNDTKHIKTHLLYGPDDGVAITIEEQVKDSNVANSNNHYAVSIQLDDLYKSRYIYTTSADDSNQVIDYKRFSYSKIPSATPQSQLVVRHNHTPQSNIQNYSVDILNYQYNRSGSLIGQRGPALTSGVPTATGNVERLVEQRFTPWGKRGLLLPLPNHLTKEADTIIALQQQGIDITDGFTGHRSILGTNLLLMGDYRLYSPDFQRFLNPDDRDTGTGISTYNRKMYANNNPVSYVDPDGHMPTPVASFFGRSCCSCSSNGIDNCELSDEGTVTPAPIGAFNMFTMRIPPPENPGNTDFYHDPIPVFSTGPELPVLPVSLPPELDFETAFYDRRVRYSTKSLMGEIHLFIASVIATRIALSYDAQKVARFGLSLCHASARASLSCAKVLLLNRYESLRNTWKYDIGSMLVFSLINSGTYLAAEWNEDTRYLETDPAFTIFAASIYAVITAWFDQKTFWYGAATLRKFIKCTGRCRRLTYPSGVLTPQGEAIAFNVGYIGLEPMSILTGGALFAWALNQHFKNFPIDGFIGLLTFYTYVRVTLGVAGFKLFLWSLETLDPLQFRFHASTRLTRSFAGVPFAEVNSRIITAMLTTSIATLISLGRY